jgi:hypothetical protein
MWSWTIAGVEYPLDTGSYCYFLGDEGSGMVPFHRLSERGPLQHGATDRGFRLDPRVLLLSIAITADSQAEYYQKRTWLTNAFKPLNVPGIVKWQIPGTVLQIDGYLVDGLQFASKDRRGWNHREVVAVRCDDPAWYDPEAVAITFALGAEGGGMPVPTPVPTPVGADTLDDARTVHYQGELPSYPRLIRITGPFVDPVITNLTIGEKLDFTGVTIAAGDYYDIDLSYLAKTVVDQAGVNKYSELSEDSSLSSWRLEAAPTAPGGLNELSITGSGLSAASRIDITYHNRYPAVGAY